MKMSQLEFLLDGADVKRYHTIRTHSQETVGHHSHGVACLCLMMNPDASASLIRAALYHDLAEQKTGDIPSPAKRMYGIGKKADEVEARVMSEAGFNMPELTADEARTLKLADIAQGALFCVREMQLGNAPLHEVYHRYMSYAWELMPVKEEYQLFKLISEMNTK